jgi:tetratricopeptide (TPR) repeat protein
MTLPSIFISYSHKDEKWKDLLKPQLGVLERDGRLTIWDDRSIDGGETWYDEIRREMQHADVAICLISADYLNSGFCRKEEIPYLLERREREGMLLLPVLIRPCLWKLQDWLKAIQMLPRDGKSVAVDFKDDPDTPFALVAETVFAFLEDPARVKITPPPPRWLPPEKIDVDRLPVTGAELFGRQNELKLLDEAWASDKINVISFVAWGGVGKSTLINKWREQMAADNYRGAQKVFAWSFYSQGTGDRVTSADLFIAEALKWFGDPEIANSSASPWDKGQRLADLVKSQKTLLLLDGMEPLQSYFEFERGKIKDPALAVLVRELAKENPGLCVITTRENVVDLADFPEATQKIDLEQISAEAGRALLRVGGVQGTDAELEQTARDFGLHALALNLLAAYIHEIPGHHISNAKGIPDIDVPLNEGKHPRRVMTAFEKRFGDAAEVELLRMLGLFSSPAEKEEIDTLRKTPAIPNLTDHLQVMSDTEWLQLVNKLRRFKLIAPESKHRPDTLDAHPSLREHFGKQVKNEYPEAWREGNNRLYEYYKSTAKELPDTLEEMTPLFAAVIHGCQAGKYQEAFDEVYWERIQRGNIYFNMNKLGAFSANLAVISVFFDPPWHKPTDGLAESDKALILNSAGASLYALGQLREAAQLLQAGLEARILQKSWDNAARSASNLSELALAIGLIEQALAYGKQGVQLADQSGNTFMRMYNRTALGDALHQAGHLAEAEVNFREAEDIQKKDKKFSPLLYSWQGYRYCDLLLRQGNYAQVQQRANNDLMMIQKGQLGSLISIALAYLSLGRSHLLQSEINSNHSVTDVANYLNRAVDSLREARHNILIPLGLLARAQYYRVTRELTKAQRDLDEAFITATRDGMGLHLADCHLEYARLYLAKGEKNKALEHWQIAKDSIEKMGYHRRDKEVQELEEQLK